MSVTVGICTKDRYLTSLPLTLTSVYMQIAKIDEIIIYDDSSNRIDMRENETLRYIFQLFDSKGIKWHVLFGEQRGQHVGHQIIQEQAKGNYIWRIDDDEIAESGVLKELLGRMVGNVGAVAGLVMLPGSPKKYCAPNKITNLNDNCQWYPWENLQGTMDAEHLYSSYLYRKGIHNFETHLSSVAHREETLHSFGIFKKGWKLIVTQQAITWHFRGNSGGIRTGKEGDFHNDELMFKGILREYGVGCQKEKNIVLREGKGDHVVFASLVPELLEKYKDYNIKFYVTYPDVFEKFNLKLHSIKEAFDDLGDVEKRFDLYKFMFESGLKLNLEQAYRKLYDI